MLEPEQTFQSYRHAKIAIYGLSPLTGMLLTKLAGYQILGLLDGYRTEGVLYNKPVFSFEEAVESGVQLIIVAARPESCKVIEKRIGAACKAHKISLLDIQGNDLCAPKKPVYGFTDVQGISKAVLAHLIGTHDVVSVDLFDTLLMRRTLFPADVFEIVDLRLKQRGVEITNFPQKRLEAEKELGKHTVPTLLEIYTYMLARHSPANISAEALVRLEWEADRDLTVPREELCEILDEAHRQKPVYIVSDTFYTKSQLAGLLGNCGINWYTDILASCDYRTGKTQQLFERLREKLPGKTCLHIGDSVDADIKGAERSGLTACQLYSGLELFERTGYLGLWEQIRGLSSRIQAGMFVSRLFNSPFQFEESGRKLHVDNAYEIGYLFFAPLINGFVIWLYRQIHCHGLKNVWFCARDGYLIQKLYALIDSGINSVYFLTSRTAAIRAGMEDEKDIRYVEEMRFSGSLPEQLNERFGISAGDTGTAGGLMDYKEEILEKAELARGHYRTYLQSLEMAEGDIAFFDFVARGTAQMYVGRLLDRHLKGFYFLRQDQEYMRERSLDILSFCQEGDLSNNYYILETVLTSPEPSVCGFDENGAPCFSPETRTKHDLRFVQNAQRGILDYVQTYLRLDPEWEGLEDKELEGAVLSLIHEIEVRDKAFLALNVEDPFFGRMSKLSDLL